MGLRLTKYAVPLTIFFTYDEETKRWASLACEITVGSDGETLDDASVALWMAALPARLRQTGDLSLAVTREHRGRGVGAVRAETALAISRWQTSAMAE